MKALFLFVTFNLAISAFAYEIKYVPLEIDTYERATIENFDNFCPMVGSYSLASLKVLNSANCSKKLVAKLNIRALIFEAPDTTILIDQDKTIILNNSICKISTKDRDKIISELEKVMKNHKRDCKNKSN